MLATMHRAATQFHKSMQYDSASLDGTFVNFLLINYNSFRENGT